MTKKREEMWVNIETGADRLCLHPPRPIRKDHHIVSDHTPCIEPPCTPPGS